MFFVNEQNKWQDLIPGGGHLINSIKNIIIRNIEWNTYK